MKRALGILGLIWKVYIALMFTISALVFYPIIRPMLGSERGRKIAFRVFVVWSWTFRIFGFYFVKRITNHPLPKGPYILLANHSSYLDIFLMYSLMPKERFLFLGKGELLKYPIIGAYFRQMNIPVFRNNRIKAAKSLIRAGEEVRKGWSIMIFPEGGIPDHDNPKLIRFKHGAFQLAKKLQIPIVPITFTNNYKLFSDPSELLGRAHPGISRVYIHPFISVEDMENLTENELKQRCFDCINAPILKEHPHLNQ